MYIVITGGVWCMNLLDLIIVRLQSYMSIIQGVWRHWYTKALELEFTWVILRLHYNKLLFC